MSEPSKVSVKLEVDNHNQWFVSILIKIGNISKPVRFRVDTGCNAVVLSHSTLKKLGLDTSEANLAKLPEISGALASGNNHKFRKLGKVSLHKGNKQFTHICTAEAICHATHETNDLLGTEAFRQQAPSEFATELCPIGGYDVHWTSFKGNRF